MKENKTETIQFRVTKEEKKKIEKCAIEMGFDTLSSYILHCVRLNKSFENFNKRINK